MSKETKEWIIHWLEKRNPGVPIDETSDIYSESLVDSFGIIELVEEVENHFSIQLEDVELHQPSFRTIQGLSEIINNKLSKESS